jgi:hypothetical protein
MTAEDLVLPENVKKIPVDIRSEAIANALGSLLC